MTSIKEKLNEIELHYIPAIIVCLLAVLTITFISINR